MNISLSGRRRLGVLTAVRISTAKRACILVFFRLRNSIANPLFAKIHRCNSDTNGLPHP